MGIVNVTPDSFSDGGRYLDAERAVEHALELVRQGADILDLGAESTRPGGGVYGEGYAEVSAAQELDRLLPVLEILCRELPATPLSIDTRKGEVAESVLAHGADMINDVGGLRDSRLIEAVAASGCPVVTMHSRGELRTMQRDVHFDDTVIEVRNELAESVERGVRGGIDREQIILDPGIGFGKGRSHNLELIGALDLLHELGLPLLLGASRKSFIASAEVQHAEVEATTGSPDDPMANAETTSEVPLPPAAPDQRLGGSLAAVAWAAIHGAAFVRVHDVRDTTQFLRVFYAIDSASSSAVRKAARGPDRSPCLSPKNPYSSS